MLKYWHTVPLVLSLLSSCLKFGQVVRSISYVARRKWTFSFGLRRMIVLSSGRIWDRCRFIQTQLSSQTFVKIGLFRLGGTRRTHRREGVEWYIMKKFYENFSALSNGRRQKKHVDLCFTYHKVHLSLLLGENYSFLLWLSSDREK